MRAKLFNRLFDYKIFYEIFFLQFLRTLKSHLRLDIKMFCRTYDFCLLCSCQSSEKKIEKKRILVLFGLSGERYEEAKERGLTLCIFMRKLSEEQDGSVDITIAAIMAERFHLFPFRTQKLSFLTPKVLSGTPLGRIGHCRFSFFESLSEVSWITILFFYFPNAYFLAFLLFFYSLLVLF